jgi:hypothetical protein
MKLNLVVVFGLFSLTSCSGNTIFNSDKGSTSSGIAYYISPNGNDANSCTHAMDPATPKQTFASAWDCLSAGDTLILRDGTYNNQDLSPPQGKAGTAINPILVRAENDGAALVNGQAILIQNSYLIFQGLKMKGRAGDSVFAIDSRDSAVTASHHITLQRMGLECPLTDARTINDSACVGIASGAHDNLIEDSWAWGGGRYTVLLYGRDSYGATAVTGADNNTLRRLVLRMGPNKSSSGNPQAALSLYYASNNTIENVIAVDSQPASDSSNSAFYITGHAAPPTISGNKFYGVLAYNTTGVGSSGFYLDADNGGDSSNTEVHDSVFWASSGEGVSVYNAIAGNNANMIIRHVTVGQSGADGYSNYTNRVSVTSSIFYNSAGYGMSNGSVGSTTENYNLLFGNGGGALKGIVAGAKDLSVNPMLSFILRTEAGSPCKGAGEGGSDCGADVSKRYVNGVKTTNDLWPWANEARLKKEMCTDSGVIRGFCSDSSLTHYLWNALGKWKPV